MEEKLNEHCFVNLHPWMVTDLNLRGNELMVYAIIFQVSQDGMSSYNGGIAYIMEWLGCCENTAIECIRRLVSKGLIEETVRMDNGNKVYAYKVILSAIPNNTSIKVDVPQQPKQQDHLYAIVDKDNNTVKIGRSKNPSDRLEQFKNSNSHDLCIAKIWPGLGMCEKAIHSQLAERGLLLKGEWFVNPDEVIRFIDFCLE